MPSFDKKFLLPALLIASQTIILYLLLVIPAEYLLTEKFLILKYISSLQKTFLFLAVFLIFFLVNYFSRRAQKAGAKFWPVFLAALFVVLLVNRAYTDFYQRLQEEPKIYRVFSSWATTGEPKEIDWSIVGMEIIIDGKNFGSAWQPGKVLVDDFEFQIKEWGEEKIIAVQPHPSRFFSGSLYVQKDNGRESNRLPFTIRDPGELEQK
ncbi:hypothetical protein KBI33_01920 [Candidatus Shapirobacteria bacterium]|nr:hypothetical protein [Candidatus Shapirobacteria bacterium]